MRLLHRWLLHAHVDHLVFKQATVRLLRRQNQVATIAEGDLALCLCELCLARGMLPQSSVIARAEHVADLTASMQNILTKTLSPVGHNRHSAMNKFGCHNSKPSPVFYYAGRNKILLHLNPLSQRASLYLIEIVHKVY